MKLIAEGGTSYIKEANNPRWVVKIFKKNVSKALQQPQHSHHRGENLYEREVDFLKVLKNSCAPHVVKLKGYDDKERKIILGKCDGDFSQYNKLTKVQLLSVLLDVAKSMDFLHDLGICHNDLGLRNILYIINGNNIIHGFVSDFGDAVYVKKTRKNTFTRYSKEALIRDYKRYYDMFHKLIGTPLNRTYDWKDAIRNISSDKLMIQ